MTTSFATFGHELYTGKRSYNFVNSKKIWFIIAAVAVALSILIPVAKGGFNLGIEFRGGSEFTVSNVSTTDASLGEKAVHDVVPGAIPRVANVAGNTMRIQTDQLTDDETNRIKDGLTSAYGVTENEVTSNFVGPTWGQDVTRQALIGLVVFVGLAAVLMALYFRTWKMSLSALVGMLVTMFTTAGVYALSDFEVTPSAIIGFLTVLSYSLYDTVVVFDKIRENTAEDGEESRRTFAESVNLAVNQTLVRSINTSVVAALPVAAILFIGAGVLGADTLRDISLALLIGILVGTWSTVFVAAPLYSQLREGEPAIRRHDQKVLKERERAASVSTAEALPTA